MPVGISRSVIEENLLRPQYGMSKNANHTVVAQLLGTGFQLCRTSSL